MESSSISTPTAIILTTTKRLVANDTNQSLIAIDATSVFVFGCITLSLLAASILTMIPKQIQPSLRTKMQCKVPCQQCRYFNANPYLKCSLHPDSVLTDGAVDCRDYLSK
jgi:hypothetical protein